MCACACACIYSLSFMRSSPRFYTLIHILIHTYIHTHTHTHTHRYGNNAWTLALPWSGQDDFVAAEEKEWKVCVCVCVCVCISMTNVLLFLPGHKIYTHTYIYIGGWGGCGGRAVFGGVHFLACIWRGAHGADGSGLCVCVYVNVEMDVDVIIRMTSSN